jgi:hypothetical protein
MPNEQIDNERRQKFKEYFDNLDKEWFFIDETIKSSIFRSITQQTEDRLGEFIETFKMLIIYTDKTNKDLKKLHNPDRRKNKHPKVKRGMFVSLIIQPKRNPSKYRYVMSLYFTYKKVIYDLKIGREDN